MKTNNKNIVLCGFMGSGKSTVGKKLAEVLGRKFVDLDLFIEEREGSTVSKIFETKGEEYFRTAEEIAAKELGDKENLVISLGGGTVLRQKNTENLKKNGFLIYLKVSAETVKQRLKNDTARPLIKGNTDEKIKNLLSVREPIYAKAADFTVDADKNVENTVNEILNTEI